MSRTGTGSARGSKTASSAASGLDARAVGPGVRRRLITLGLMVGTFLASIEATVVGTAMPSIAAQLGGLALYPWVFSAYLLAQTISIPLYGRLADLIGRRKTFVGGVSLFLLGSVACGLAPSMKLLVAARALQGLGAGAVLPLTMTIFGDLYDVALRTKLQGLFSLVWGVSSVAGPLTGGAIVSYGSWRWVFLLNIPFGLVSMAFVGLLLREPPGLHREHRLDLGGAGLLAVSTLSLLVALLPEAQRPLGLHPALWIALAAVATAGFVGLERRHREPLVPLDLFRDRVQLAANVAGVLLGVVLFGVVSYAPLYVQDVRGGTPVQAGAALIPLSLGWTTASVLAGRLVGRFGFQFLVRAGSVMVGGGSLIALGGVWLNRPVLGLLGLTGYGVGMGFLISSFTVSVQERVPTHRKGIATALTQFSRSIGGAVGVALLGALLLFVAGVDSSATDLGSIGSGMRHHLYHGLAAVFAVCAGSAVAAGALGVWLFPRVEAGLQRKRRRG